MIAAIGRSSICDLEMGTCDCYDRDLGNEKRRLGDLANCLWVHISVRHHNYTWNIKNAHLILKEHSTNRKKSSTFPSKTPWIKKFRIFTKWQLALSFKIHDLQSVSGVGRNPSERLPSSVRIQGPSTRNTFVARHHHGGFVHDLIDLRIFRCPNLRRGIYWWSCY